MRYLYKKYTFIIFIFAFLTPSLVVSQNLIPNPSFDNSILTDCPPNPDNALPLAAPWYIAFEGPDFFVNDCSPDFLIFRDRRPTQAHEGNSHVGIWASTYGGGFATGDAFGVQLLEPLEDKMYYFSTYVYNRGTINPEQPNVFCPTVPSRHIGVYLSEDSIYGVNVINPTTQEIEDAYIEGDLVWADSSLSIIQTAPSNRWFKIEGCLKAQGGEKHLAIAPPMGNHEYMAGCPFFSYGEFFFQTYYYDFDQVSLEVLPSSFEVNATVCEDEGTLVDVIKLIPDIRFRNGTVIWEDGTISNTKMLKESGIYDIELLLGCGTIPVRLTVSSTQCKSKFFVPNAFTPNADSHNDVFQPFINPVGVIRDYEFRVYNRFGQLLFASDTEGEGWDGTFQGEKMNDGVYIWELNFSVMEQSELRQVQETGDVTLLR